MKKGATCRRPERGPIRPGGGHVELWSGGGTSLSRSGQQRRYMGKYTEPFNAAQRSFRAGSCWLLIAPLDRHDNLPASVAFPAAEPAFQVKDGRIWRQPQPLLQAAGRDHHGMAADALDL